jgi:imidazoleglycerol-phosphate dehydratase
MRTSNIERETEETNISAKVNLDGKGQSKIDTPIAFFSHMLTSFATHSLIDLQIKANGDLKHHIIEDTAICLGEALRKAVNKTPNIKRFGFSSIPMDCSLAQVSVDISGRPYYKIDFNTTGTIIEDCPIEDLEHFIKSLAISLQANVHVQVLYGENDHHKVEAVFKALAVSLRQAFKIDMERKDTPSSKGVL